jgi:hypothetical protein
MRYCRQLDTVDALACVRGVANQAFAGKPRAERSLLRDCLWLRAGARRGCAAWFAQTFNVVENGRFSCTQVVASLRASCAVGVRRWTRPLVTFA